MNRNSMLRRKSYWLKKMQVELYNELLDFVKTNELSQNDIAERLGVSKGYVSKLFKGKIDHKFSKLIDLAFLMEKVPIVNWPQLKNYEKKEDEGMMLPYKVFEYYSMKDPNTLKYEELFSEPLKRFNSEYTADIQGTFSQSYNVPSKYNYEPLIES